MVVEFFDFDGLTDHDKEEILSFIDPLKKFVKLPWDNRSNILHFNLLNGKMPPALDVFALECEVRDLNIQTDLPCNDAVTFLNGNDSIMQKLYTSQHNGQIVDDKSRILNAEGTEYGLVNGGKINNEQLIVNGINSLNASELVNDSKIADIQDSKSEGINVQDSEPVSCTSANDRIIPNHFNDTCATSIVSSLHSKELISDSVESDENIDLKSVNSISHNTPALSCNSLVNDHCYSDSVKVSLQNSEAEVSENKTVKNDMNGNTQDNHSSVNSSPEHQICAKIDEKNPSVNSTLPKVRSFADVLRNNNKTLCLAAEKKIVSQNQVDDNLNLHLNDKICGTDNDKLIFTLGKYFTHLELDFSPISLQPRGLINRRNWCYINATLQALLACPPLYRFLINMPSLPANKRGQSSTPVIDSMVHFANQFQQITMSPEDFKAGVPFQPTAIYEMLGSIKSDCSKGQQEDAEEFLSLLLNKMHEEVTFVTRSYQKTSNPTIPVGINGNNNDDDADNDGWQVIGAKQRGMITRKVVEHKTPISDLLGGQIVSFLTTNGKATMSASVQPFFTLQLDIQANHVNTLEEALLQMTIKEAIQGYTCTKTKQEVEAFCKILLQKLPPVLILHLKRFIYDKDGGCKKVMKHTQYPMILDLKKELFSSEFRKKKPPSYRLFAVMYHDGEEAVKGHYVSDIYHYGCSSWIRCDDRKIFVIPEVNVLSHSPPRVPYLLFYQMTNFECEKI